MRLNYDIGRADRQRTVSPITNTKYALSRLSPSLRRNPFCRRADGLNIIYEVAAIARASTALSEKGPSAAVARGRKGGRKPVVTSDKLQRAREKISNGLNVREAAGRVRVSKTALYAALQFTSASNI